MGKAAVTTHVLDLDNGYPAANIAAALAHPWSVFSGTTNDDGRIDEWSGDVDLRPEITLTFAVGAYFEETARDSFYSDVTVRFIVERTMIERISTPLLLSPFHSTTAEAKMDRIIRARGLHFPGATDDSMVFHEDAVLCVEDGKIVEFDQAETLQAQGLDLSRCEHYPDQVLMPGFIDPHIHFPQLDVVASYGTRLLEWLETLHLSGGASVF